MHRQALCAVLLAFAATALLPTAPAGAASAQLEVRIEGRGQTLFEGPLLSDGHYLRAASSTAVHHCDGTNAGAHPAPGPTPTAAAWDAMALVGQGFDGRWYSGYDDYVVQQWGPDREDYDGYAFWGVLVDGSFLGVGGCQYRAVGGDEVLWAYDAFDSRPFLRLAAAADPSPAPGPPDPVAYAEPGQPLRLLVQRYSGAMDGGAQNLGLAVGVPVAPVRTDPASGFETVEAGGTPSGGDGGVELTFAASEAGWHRLKAADDASYVRSNRLDVCVRPAPGQGCGPLPADAQVRRYAGPLPEPPAGNGGGSGGGGGASDGGTGGGAGGSGGAGSGGKAGRGAAGSTGDRGGKAGDGSKGGAGDRGGEAGRRGRGAYPRARLGRLKLAPRRGTATLTVRVGGPARLRLSGAGLRPAAARARAAGRVRLALRPSRAGRRALRRRGRLAVVAKVRVRGAAGTTLLRRSLTLRLTGAR